MWDVTSTDTFDEWFKGLTDSDRADMLATMKVLQ